MVFLLYLKFTYTVPVYIYFEELNKQQGVGYLNDRAARSSYSWDFVYY